MFPDVVMRCLDKKAQEIGIRPLLRISDEISSFYLSDKKHHGGFDWSAERAVCYALARMPATYAASEYVLGRLFEENVFLGEMTSHLDMCSGPGTMALAVRRFVGAGCRETLCVEREQQFVSLASDLVRAYAEEYGNGYEGFDWICQDVDRYVPKHRYDMVTVGYGLNEMNDDLCLSTVQKAWRATSGILLILDPGTPRDFDRLLRIRDFMKQEDDCVLLGPCPHWELCGMTALGEKWCHFGCRLSRTRAHRLLKGGEAGFEDEKFTWLAFARVDFVQERLGTGKSRIVSHPRIGNKQVTLDLCHGSGIWEPSVTLHKCNGEPYKIAKKRKWGELFG